MPTNWKISSIPPHDFTLCLDIDSYFDYEHNPESIFHEGFTRSLPLQNRDILVTVDFNGDPDDPEFSVKTEESLSDDGINEATNFLKRILGTDLDLKPLYDQAGSDPVLAPLFDEFYGLKRISRANFFEDAVNRIIRMQIKHKPTARRMVHDFRAAYAPKFDHKGQTIPGWPRPERIAGGDPDKMKQYGLSRRKGEYIVELAELFTGGSITHDQLESLPPYDFYEIVTGIRGIGPIAAQDLMLFRNRSDGVFPGYWQKGMEKGLRRWIILSYGGDPETMPEYDFQESIRHWKGFEALALEHLYVNYIMEWKKKMAAKSKAGA